MKATAKDLRLYSKELLEAVSQGEEVVITYRGKPTARLVPLQGEVGKEEATPGLFRMWKDLEDLSVEEFIDNLRKSRH